VLTIINGQGFGVFSWISYDSYRIDLISRLECGSSYPTSAPMLNGSYRRGCARAVYTSFLEQTVIGHEGFQLIVFLITEIDQRKADLISAMPLKGDSRFDGNWIGI